MSIHEFNWTETGVVAKVLPVEGAPVGDPFPRPTGEDALMITAKKVMLLINPLLHTNNFSLTLSLAHSHSHAVTQLASPSVSQTVGRSLAFSHTNSCSITY
jgi:hypothetical protein